MTEDNELDAARAAIDAVDREIAALFQRRMQAVARIAGWRAQRGLPAYDAGREAEMTQRNAARVDPQLAPYYLRFLERTIDVSRQYQRLLLQGVRVAYSGVEGAFAWTAALHAFPDAHLCAYPSFGHAYQAVVDGDCDCAVLPIENSEAGEVGQVMDLLFSGPLVANRVFSEPIVQNLLGLPGARLADIRTVTSHPQALAQCADYLAEHGWELRESTNTAVAAKSVLEAGDATCAAIAGAESARFWGLEVLERSINQSRVNTTRFAVLSRTPAQRACDRFMLMFTVKDEAGALARAINVIGDRGFNMHALRSRPMRSLAWSYYFYIEAEGDPSSADGQAMMRELAPVCDRLKVVGQYASRNDAAAPLQASARTEGMHDGLD